MKILGIDPSLSNFGMVVMDLNLDTMKIGIDRLILVETSPSPKNKKVRKNSEDLERCRLLFGELSGALVGIDMVCCEIPVGSQSARAMASYGFCIGILSSIDAPLIQVTPSEVKMVATGDKNASKAEMIEWGTQKYPHPDWLRDKKKFLGKNEHLADAVAAVEAGLLTDQFKSARAILSWSNKKVA